MWMIINTILVSEYQYHQYWCWPPTLSLGISRSSDPCFRKTLPAVCWGLIPIPSSVMMALRQQITFQYAICNLNTFPASSKLNRLITDHAPGCWWHLKLLRGKLEHSGEGSPVRNGEHFERQLRVRGQRDLERHFGASCSHLLWLCGSVIARKLFWLSKPF